MDRDDWRLCRSAFEWLQGMARRWLGGEMSVDRMASRANTRLARFNSVSSIDPAAEGFSAFSVDWSAEPLSYVFPPFAFIPRVLQHVKECGARAVVIVPEWPSQCWWRELVSMAVTWWHFPEREIFERVVDGDWRKVQQGQAVFKWGRVNKMSFTPVAVVLDGRMQWG